MEMREEIQRKLKNKLLKDGGGTEEECEKCKISPKTAAEHNEKTIPYKETPWWKNRIAEVIKRKDAASQDGLHKEQIKKSEMKYRGPSRRL